MKHEKQTFLVEVVDQQNASWQGSINWLNRNKKESFRSALEMIRLMDSALTESSSQQDDAKEEEV